MTAPARIDIRTTRGLALALPIAPGDRVLVVGGGLRHLVVSLANTRAEPVVITTSTEDEDIPDGIAVRHLADGRPLQIDEAGFDHAILVGSANRWTPSDRAEVARAVAPGGSVLLALTVPSRRQGPKKLLAQSDAALRAAGIEVEARYGVRQTLRDVRHLVPLGGPALRWYLRDAFLPNKRWTALAARVAAAAAPRRALLRAFPAVAVVGRRPPDDEPAPSC